MCFFSHFCTSVYILHVFGHTCALACQDSSCITRSPCSSLTANQAQSSPIWLPYLACSGDPCLCCPRWNYRPATEHTCIYRCSGGSALVLTSILTIEPSSQPPTSLFCKLVPAEILRPPCTEGLLPTSVAPFPLISSRYPTLDPLLSAEWVVDATPLLPTPTPTPSLCPAWSGLPVSWFQ